MGDLKIGKAEIGRIGLPVVVDESIEEDEAGGKRRIVLNWRMIIRN